MKKIKILFTVVLAMLILINIKSIKAIANEQEDYIAQTYIENPSEIGITDATEKLEINGWYMSNDPQANIKIYIDDIEQEISNLERYERQDVINAIKGYGTIEENPMPGFSAEVDTSKIKLGQHILKVEIESQSGKKLTYNIRTINIKNIYNAQTYIENIVTTRDEVTIDGWYMSNDKNAQLKISIDNKEQEIKEIQRYERQDVINAIKGFGSSEQNPNPGYSAKLDISSLKSGEHTIKTEIKSQAGDVLDTDIRTINIIGYKADMYVESLNNRIENTILGDKISIDGWLMTNDINSELKVYIDGKEQKIAETQRFERQDVINAIKGFGTAEQNPMPGFSLKIDLAEINDGKHTIKVNVESKNGEILVTNTLAINLKKYVAQSCIETPSTIRENNILGTNLFIGGWVMTTDTESKIKIYVDGKEQNVGEIQRHERQDVLNAIKDYGNVEQNPTPGFSLNIDLSKFNDGKHIIKINVESATGELLSSGVSTINLQKYNGQMYIENPKVLGVVKPIINIDGWIMTTESETDIKFYIDGKEQEIVEIQRHERQDVLNGIKECGTAIQNPKPGFSAELNTIKIGEGTHVILVEVRAKNGDIIVSEQRNIIIEKYKANVCVETPSEMKLQEVEGKTTNVDGWLMTDDTEAQIKIYVDGNETKAISEERAERQDVINAIKGFGTAEQNKKPGFSYTIDITDLKDGEHTIRVDIVSRTGDIIASNKRIINVNRYNADAYIDMPLIMGQSKAKLNIAGWVMTTDEQATLNFYINNQKQDVLDLIRTERQDVLNAIKGFGGKEKNPTPGFEAEIDISKFEDGKADLKFEVVSREGEILYSETRKIVIYNKYDIGIDVSVHNGSIDWGKVKKSGIQFTMIRAAFRGYGTGSLNVDRTYMNNIKNALANGLEVGVYVYSQAITIPEAIEEAEFMLKLVNDYGYGDKLTYPIAIDVEQSGGRADSLSVADRTAIIRAFIERIRQDGKKAMLYANKDWLENQIDMSQLKDCDVWLAHYTRTDDPINNPSSYKGDYTIWQYTSKGSVPGVPSEFVDIDICYKKYFRD